MASPLGLDRARAPRRGASARRRASRHVEAHASGGRARGAACQRHVAGHVRPGRLLRLHPAPALGAGARRHRAARLPLRLARREGAARSGLCALAGRRTPARHLDRLVDRESPTARLHALGHRDGNRSGGGGIGRHRGSQAPRARGLATRVVATRPRRGGGVLVVLRRLALRSLVESRPLASDARRREADGPLVLERRHEVELLPPVRPVVRRRSAQLLLLRVRPGRGAGEAHRHPSGDGVQPGRADAGGATRCGGILRHPGAGVVGSRTPREARRLRGPRRGLRHRSREPR